MPLHYLAYLGLASLAAALVWAAFVRLGRRRKTPRWRRIAQAVLLVAVAVVPAVLAAVGTGNALLSASYFAGHRPAGILPTVDGYRTHLFCSGHGSPAVVLEAGFGSDFLDWRFVQAGLSNVTTVCSYDRAGYGWSAARPGPRDADAVARNLHALLRAGNIRAPFILAGHSMGGLYVRRYAALYPRDLSGLALVDASTPLQEDRLDPELTTYTEQQVRLLAGMSFFGLSRPMGACEASGPDRDALKAQAEDMCRPAAGRIFLREMAGFRDSGRETLGGTFGDLPLLVISHDPKTQLLPADFGVAREKKFQADWNRMQEDMKALSTQSRRIVVKGSGHNIQIDRPQVLVRELAGFVRQIRAGEATANSATTTAQ
jgi:pimeloyl-ACP methyl ester carboxylesterase